MLSVHHEDSHKFSEMCRQNIVGGEADHDGWEKLPGGQWRGRCQQLCKANGFQPVKGQQQQQDGRK